jgi:hypothetical protein
MLSARKFALANSSSSRSVVDVSVVDKVAYRCDYARRDLGPHYECVPTEEYCNIVLANWINARALDAIRPASCAYWASYDSVRPPSPGIGVTEAPAFVFSVYLVVRLPLCVIGEASAAPLKSLLKRLQYGAEPFHAPNCGKSPATE